MIRPVVNSSAGPAAGARCAGDVARPSWAAAYLAAALCAPSALTLLAGPSAATTFGLPQGCTGLVTVQGAACTVDHHYTCAADPAGWQRRVSFDEGGLTYAGAIDDETQWVESLHVASGHSERLAPANPDPASFTELLETGIDTYDFTTLSDEIGPTRYVGRDILTGETEVIDGVELQVTDYAIRAETPDGRTIWSAQGREYIHEGWRRFLSGHGDYATPDMEWSVDDSPVEFIYPGEPGYLSAEPKYGCGAMLSAFER